MSDLKKEFKVGDYLVYPRQGVGKVTNVDYIDFKGKKELYYTVYIISNDMMIKFPHFNMKNLGIRKISSVAKAKEILSKLLSSDESDKYESDWKIRQNINLELLKRSNIEDIASIIKMLYHRSRIKELPIAEKKTYTQAYSIFVDEISIALNKSSEKITEDILNSLNLNYNNLQNSKAKKKDDEDEEIED